MLAPSFSLNGKLFPIDQAVIPLDNLEFSYGFGVYEIVKVRNKILYFPEKHIERLFHSAKTINLTVPLSSEAVFSALQEFIRVIPEQSYNIKILCVAGNLYIFATAPFFVPDKLYRSGVSVITFHGERLFPQAKTLNMLMSYQAYAQAKEQQAYDALLVDNLGFIREGTRTNFFFTDGKTIFTPPAEHVLEGVTKLTLTEALRQNGIEIIEKQLPLSELKQYLGFFLTSTSSKVLPITSINRITFAIPEIIKTVMKIYDEYLNNYAATQKKLSFSTI